MCAHCWMLNNKSPLVGQGCCEGDITVLIHRMIGMGWLRGVYDALHSSKTRPTFIEIR